MGMIIVLPRGLGERRPDPFEPEPDSSQKCSVEGEIGKYGAAAGLLTASDRRVERV